MAAVNGKIKTIKLCTAHPYRWLFGLFWFGLAILLGWTYFSRPDPIIIGLIVMTVLAALFNWFGERCLQIKDGWVVLEQRPLGRFARQSWPLDSVAEFTWDANRQVDDPLNQIQSRPLKYKVYVHLQNGRFRPLLTFFQEEAAAEAAGRLNALLENAQPS